MINLVVLDIDGVITDGSVIIDSIGTEQKKINLKDIDAIFELHRQGYKLAAITGEDTDIVRYFKKRFPWDYFYSGSKTKKDALKQIEEGTGIDRSNICYVGDGKYDIEPLSYVGLGICPANAIDRAKDSADIILQNNGGDGCLWELLSILDDYNDNSSSGNYFYQRISEHTKTFKKMASDRELISTVMRIADELVQIYNKNGCLFLCGNGGSAADAQHIAAEFVSRFYKERPGLNAEALSTNSSIVTAIGNDYRYERIFSRQLEAKARPGDMLIGISTSGTSKNVVEALDYARNNDICTVLLTGASDNLAINDSAEYIVRVPSLITPRIQEAHIFIGHLIAEYVEARMFGGAIK